MTQAPARTAFRVLLTMRIKEGLSAEFERTWRDVAGLIAANPGNLGQWLARDTEHDDVYWVLSDWLDEDSFREFEHSEDHVRHREKLAPYRRGGSMETMRVVAALPGPAHDGQADLRDSGQVRAFVYYATDDPADIEHAYHRVSSQMEGTPGLLGNELLHSIHDPTGFVVSSRWTRVEAHRGWAEGPVHDDVTAPLRPFRDSRLDRPFGVYQVRAEY